jgi:hypothetical protein
MRADAEEPSRTDDPDELARLAPDDDVLNLADHFVFVVVPSSCRFTLQPLMMSSRSTTVTPSFVSPAVCARVRCDGRHKQCHQTGVQHLAHCHLLLVSWDRVQYAATAAQDSRDGGQIRRNPEKGPNEGLYPKDSPIEIGSLSA